MPNQARPLRVLLLIFVALLLLLRCEGASTSNATEFAAKAAQNFGRNATKTAMQTVASTAMISGSASSATLATIEVAAEVGAMAASEAAGATAGATGAAAGAMGPALGSMIANMQTFVVLAEVPTYSVFFATWNATANATHANATHSLNATRVDAIGSIAALRDSMAWAIGEAKCPFPRESTDLCSYVEVAGENADNVERSEIYKALMEARKPKSKPEKNKQRGKKNKNRGLKEIVAEDDNVVVGDNPVGYLVDVILTRRQSFNRMVFWAAIFGMTLSFVYGPIIYFARQKMNGLHSKERVDPKKRSGKKARTWHERKPTLLERFSYTHPRVVHCLLFLSFQGMCKNSAFVAMDYTATTARRVLGFGIVALFGMGFIAYVYWTVKRKVLQERRAVLVSSDGWLRWIDRKPESWDGYRAFTGEGDGTEKPWFTGFCSGHGALFEVSRTTVLHCVVRLDSHRCFAPYLTDRTSRPTRSRCLRPPFC